MNFLKTVRTIYLSRLFQTLKRPYLISQVFIDIPNDFWINHNAKKWFLENAKGKRVFEYGCGYSTAKIEKVAKEIISVEDNKEWRNKVKKELSKGKIILAKTKEGYVKEIKKHGLFDIVFIDGNHRKECAEFAWNYIKPKGFMVIDDVNGPHFENFEKFKPKSEHFRLGGFKSNTGGYWETGIIIKE